MARLRRSSFMILACVLSFARSHIAYLGGQNHLHQVQSLYVKPSSDGTTGDLFVSATEETPKQWLEQPGYLPQQFAYPVSYTASLTTSNLPGETIVTNQKRAVVSSAPFQYSYAVPASADNSGAVASTPAAIPYPYAIATTPSTAEGKDCADKTANPALPVYQYPFYHYYAQMMSAFANAMNNYKESSGEEGSSPPATPQIPTWPSYYPYQYVMVDPNAWAQAAKAASTAQPTSTPATPAASASEETE